MAIGDDIYQGDLMAFEWDPAERAAFDTALIAHLAAQLPDATFGWTEYSRRLLVTFPDGIVCSIWEPNFFFSWPSFSQEHLFAQAAAHIIASHSETVARIAETGEPHNGQRTTDN